MYDSIPTLLGAAWLLPLLSFTIIVLFGPKLGPHGKYAGYVAAGAIVTGFVLSLVSLITWLSVNGVKGNAGHHESAQHITAPHDPAHPVPHADANHPLETGIAPEFEGTKDVVKDPTSTGTEIHPEPVPPLTGEWYVLGEIGHTLRLTIGYHIDALTVIMFTMVTLIASCIHFYAMGYMHDELHTITDHEVTLVPNPYGEHSHDDHGHHSTAVTAHDTHTVSHDDDAAHHDHGHGGHGGHGNHLVRPGRFHRFFQYLSLFCFSMLGLVYAGNIAMVFVFWELVGICSYFLIGFYRERHSASTAANKAFIVNRVGDFGMLIGLMALWGALGTFNFSDVVRPDGTTDKGIFTLVRPTNEHHQLTVPSAMVLDGASVEAQAIRASAGNAEAAKAAVDAKVGDWRKAGYGYWLLTIAGLGIFCGCVGKSAQFPLHVWLPDAMEGPTPVSALVHSATMVAAGVYLVGRFFPVFTPEALLVIAYIGAITLFIAATIAITATDIKRVLAYSTVSQLGYMMLALGLGGWLAGLFHLITHAFFKSLLFMCSGSVIHACHTNEMPRMGGLLKKMPWTGYTMLIGCLAIAGAGIPLTPIGLSGYYSKDAIIEQAYSFSKLNPAHQILFYAPTIGAAITAFYMFRMWFLTFVGKPRDKHVYDHVHESPPVMYVPLVILSVFAVCVGWPFLGLTKVLEQARPLGTLGGGTGAMWNVVVPDEHLSHQSEIAIPAGLAAFTAAAIGVLIAAIFYAWKKANPEDVRRAFSPLYNFLRGKWYFDELYQYLFIAPTHFIARRISDFDKQVIDRIIHGTATLTRGIARADDLLDRFGVDGLVNGLATWTRSLGYSLRSIQTGSLRQYVMFIAAGTVAVFVIVSLLWNWAIAG